MAQNSGETKRVFLWIKQKDITDGGDVLYLRRWILAKVFGWKFMLHKIVSSDHDRCHHDHPWGFFGFILKGGYTEEVPVTPGDIENTRVNVVKRWSFINRMDPNYTHRIRSLLNGPSWTLLISTPVRRGWGFFTPHGWLGWREFLRMNPLTRVLWCGTEDE